jgi:hypothetical protein
MKEVVVNELTDRAQQLKWIYLIDKRGGKQTFTEQQVDKQTSRPQVAAAYAKVHPDKSESAFFNSGFSSRWPN